MPTIEEIRQWTFEQRREYFMTEACQALNITPGEIDMEYNDDEWCVNLIFDDELWGATYDPMLNPDGGFDVRDANRQFVGEDALVRINLAIKHVRNARRVVELEAKIKLLEANTARILPQPIGEALMEEWH